MEWTCRELTMRGSSTTPWRPKRARPKVRPTLAYQHGNFCLFHFHHSQTKERKRSMNNNTAEEVMNLVSFWHTCSDSINVWFPQRSRCSPWPLVTRSCPTWHRSHRSRSVTWHHIVLGCEFVPKWPGWMVSFSGSALGPAHLWHDWERVGANRGTHRGEGEPLDWGRRSSSSQGLAKKKKSLQLFCLCILFKERAASGMDALFQTVNMHCWCFQQVCSVFRFKYNFKMLHPVSIKHPNQFVSLL